MAWWGKVVDYLKNLGIYSTTINIGDVIEILIIAFLLYYLLKWTKTTRAWSLLKGIIVIVLFLLVAFLANMDTILWIAQKIINYAVFALLIVLQPELRKGLENLGRKNMLASIITSGVHHGESENITADTISELVKACTTMGKAKTGALIVLQRNESLTDYETTGIAIDAKVSGALLINIFEKNTPLHDGAVIIVGNRVTSATCYLPRTESLKVSKALGTRHRAAIGASENTDSVTIVVSEETGRISLAVDGELENIPDGESLRTRLSAYMLGTSDEDSGKSKRTRKRKKKEKRDNAQTNKSAAQSNQKQNSQKQDNQKQDNQKQDNQKHDTKKDDSSKQDSPKKQNELKSEEVVSDEEGANDEKV